MSPGLCGDQPRRAEAAFQPSPAGIRDVPKLVVERVNSYYIQIFVIKAKLMTGVSFTTRNNDDID